MGVFFGKIEGWKVEKRLQAKVLMDGPGDEECEMRKMAIESCVGGGGMLCEILECV